MQDETNIFSPEELQNSFDAIKDTDAQGREWWNSRRLARVMGYQKYWNFERLMDKVATFLQQEKGLNLKEHMVEIDESVKLQLSKAIIKILIPLDNCEDAGRFSIIMMPDVCSVNHEVAEVKTLGEYEKFWRIQDKTILSDFDKMIEGIE